MELLKTPPTSFTNLVKDLSTNLTALQPSTETAQLITYALIATAVVGIMVYHYIKYQESEQEKSELLRELKKELEND